MEQKQAPQPSLSTIAIKKPHFVNEKPKPSYFIRLFSGRLNRQNYIVGSTVFILVPLICFLIVIFSILLSPSTFAMPYLDPTNPGKIISPHVSIISLLETPANEIWTVIGAIFILLSIPYLFSLQIRRLHDLNLTGWLWIITILPLVFINSMFSFTELSRPDIWFWTGNFVSLASGIFSIYVTLWPGTNGPNHYGTPPLPRSNFLGDVLMIT